MNDTSFINKFETCDFTVKDLSHENHVRMAFLYLKENELPEALKLIRDGIKHFATFHGADALYHETITYWYAVVINDHLAPNRKISWDEFKLANKNLVVNSKEFLGLYYSAEVIGSPLAKTQFLLPDKLNIGSKF